MTRKHYLLMTVIVLMLAVAGWWGYARHGQLHTSDARIEGQMISVASRLSGWLTDLPVTEGDHINKGQPLAQVDDRANKLQLSSVEAQVNAAAAKLEQLRAQKSLSDARNSAALQAAQATLSAAQAALDSSQHQATLAQAEFQRINKLRKKGLSNQQDWDMRHSALLESKDTLAQRQAQLKAAEAQLSGARAQLAQSRVLTQQILVQQQQQQQLAAQAAELKQDLTDRQLRSPVTGVVDKTLTEAGNYVQAGQWLMLVHDPSKIWVEANIKETAIAKVKVGQPVTISVDAYPNQVFHGKVIRVGNAATNQFAMLPSPNPSGNFTKITQRVPVRIAFDNLDSRLKPGLMVEITIHVGS
ncbi:HlyD family secretion protein [Gallaecimonas sp. GXIMD1310]|uniref:HlyD family secretion protein n=1 Tax=Gallaecimonas sp. GXIMD1310 TaxID=3131926 RepID=UPI003249A5B2